jgi:hypothetical protein
MQTIRVSAPMAGAGEIPKAGDSIAPSTPCAIFDAYRLIDVIGKDIEYFDHLQPRQRRSRRRSPCWK